jgi:hypothetical protein
LKLFQSDVNRFSAPIQVQDHPELEGSVRDQPSQIDASRPTCKVESRQRHTWRNPTPITDSVTKILLSLDELKQRAASQTRALQDLNSRALASSPTGPLLKDINTHHLEMEAILAALTAVWCKDSSVAIQMKQDLKSELRENIQDIEHLKNVLTNANTPGVSDTTRKVITVDKQSKVLDRERTVHYTDVSGRRVLYPLLARLQLLLAAKLVPSACPGLSGPLDSSLK